MSTKRLARTVIEGGRAYYNAYSRRESHRRQRVRLREWLASIRRDPELAQRAGPPVLRPVPKWFHDKLAPAERWLRRRAGRPWSEVEGEIFRVFDVRSLPGRHIVFDHLLPRYHGARVGWRVHRRGWFHVDGHGVLRFSKEVPPHHPQARFHRPWVPKLYPFLSPRVQSIARDRRVGARPGQLYWLHPTRVEGRYRQGAALSAAERAWYAALSEAERAALERPLP